MARSIFLLAVVVQHVLLGCSASPIVKRSNHDYLFNKKHALQGVEVNGLFNPMERYKVVVAPDLLV
jgi:hypothetical protein